MPNGSSAGSLAWTTRAPVPEKTAPGTKAPVSGWPSCGPPRRRTAARCRWATPGRACAPWSGCRLQLLLEQAQDPAHDLLLELLPLPGLQELGHRRHPAGDGTRRLLLLCRLVLCRLVLCRLALGGRLLFGLGRRRRRHPGGQHLAGALVVHPLTVLGPQRGRLGLG